MKKRRFSRDDWITLGLTELSTNGPEGVKLEAICNAARLTRGSFYHHFNDHETFLLSLAERWLNSQTTQGADNVEKDASPTDQSFALTEAAMQIDYRLELGMRELGRRAPAIGGIIKKADTIRVETLSSLYQQRYGLDATTAGELAFLEYATFSGIILLDPDMPQDRQKSLADLYDKTVSRSLTKKDHP